MPELLIASVPGHAQDAVVPHKSIAVVIVYRLLRLHQKSIIRKICWDWTGNQNQGKIRLSARLCLRRRPEFQPWTGSARSISILHEMWPQWKIWPIVPAFWKIHQGSGIEYLAGATRNYGIRGKYLRLKSGLGKRWCGFMRKIEAVQWTLAM